MDTGLGTRPSTLPLDYILLKRRPPMRKFKICLLLLLTFCVSAYSDILNDRRAFSHLVH